MQCIIDDTQTATNKRVDKTERLALTLEVSFTEPAGRLAVIW